MKWIYRMFISMMIFILIGCTVNEGATHDRVHQNTTNPSLRQIMNIFL